MIDIVFHREFIKDARRLPKAQQRKLAYLIECLRENPYNPLLHTKHLAAPLIGLLSFRITRDWRVMFRFLDERTIQLTQVEHRRDIYR
jgi:addiction module RelE/StbE family toxin